MKKQFAAYEIALALEDIGFNEECFCTYSPSEILHYEQFDDELLAPLWQQVIGWFATKYNIHIYILHTMKTTEGFRFLYVVEEWGDDDMVCDCTDYFKTYEEAREAAILEAIKLVKENKK